MVYYHNIGGQHQFVIACFGQKHSRFEETIQSNNEHADILEFPQYLNLSIQVAYTYLRLSGRVQSINYCTQIINTSQTTGSQYNYGSNLLELKFGMCFYFIEFVTETGPRYYTACHS